jgi:hypothetical protein
LKLEAKRVGSWQQAGRILQALRESCGWSVPMLAVELEAQARVIGRPLTNRESLIRRIYDWEAGGHRPRDYYILFILVYASDEELAARTIEHGSQLASAFHGAWVAVVWAAVGWCGRRPGTVVAAGRVLLAPLRRPWGATGGWLGMAA